MTGLRTGGSGLAAGLAILLAAADGPAAASGDGRPIAEIVVSARSAGKAPSGPAVIVVPPAAVREGLRIDEALAREPLFSAFRRQDSRTAHPTTSTASLLLKGPNATSRALVVVDGLPLNDPFSGAIAWSLLPPILVTRLRLDPRPAVGAFGDRGEGGVIAITTRLADPEPGWAVSTAGGSRADAALSAYGAIGNGRLRIAGYGFGNRSGGFQPVPRRLRGPADRRLRSRAGGGGAALSGPLGARMRWQLRAMGFREARAGGLPQATNGTRGIEAAALIAGELAAGWRLSAAAFHRRRLFRNRFAAVLDEARSRTRPVLDQFRVPGRASGGNLDLAWTGEDGLLRRLAFGIDGERTRGATHERFRNLGSGFTRERLAGGASARLGGYLEAELAAPAGWTVTVTARADSWRIAAGRETIRALADGRLLEETRIPARRGVVATGGVTATGRLARGLRLHLSARRGWRLPTLNELFRPFRVGNTATLANAGLAPERVAALQLALSGPADARISWRLGGHLGRLVDGIGNVTIGSGPGRFASVGFLPAGGILRQRRNIPRIRTAGILFGAGVPLWPGARIAVEGLFRDERITRAGDAARDLAGRRVAQLPRLSARIAFAQDVSDRLSVSLRLRYLGRAFEDDRASLLLDRAAVVGATLAWRPRPHWTVTVTAENVFDTTVMNRIAPDGLITRARPPWLLLRLVWRS